MHHAELRQLQREQGMTFLSFFAGIGGFDLGFQESGMQCLGHVEIDPTCQRVLERHWPGKLKGTDVTKYEHTGPQPDVICGGFPCQDLSVAGKRKGLAGERSGLWFAFRDIIADLKPRWVVIENVPGLLSSHEGRDFALLLHGLAELGYRFGSRVLDSQYLGVPQRRRRVFIVGSLGDGSCVEVLFEPESLCGDSPPSRETGKETPYPTSPCLSASGRGTERAGESRGQDCVIPQAFGGNNTTRPIDIATACNAHGGTGRIDFESEPFIAGTLTANGKAAGSATQQDAKQNLLVTQSRLISYRIHGENSVAMQGGGDAEVAAPVDKTRCLDSNGGYSKNQGGNVVLAFSCKDNGRDVSEIAPTLRAMPHDKSHQNGGGQVAIAFDTTQITSKANRSNPKEGAPCHPLAAGAHAPAITIPLDLRNLQRRKDRDEVNRQSLGVGKEGDAAHTVTGKFGAVAFQESQSGCREYDDAGTLRSQGPGHDPVGTRLRTTMGVRRLTPRECERLQGFPDDWTRWDAEGKEISDSARYRMIGNAVTVNVARWIGKQLMAVQTRNKT
jgi:DNA (cytosine-5)-methyltransferase 1